MGVLGSMKMNDISRKQLKLRRGKVIWPRPKNATMTLRKGAFTRLPQTIHRLYNYLIWKRIKKTRIRRLYFEHFALFFAQLTSWKKRLDKKDVLNETLVNNTSLHYITKNGYSPLTEEANGVGTLQSSRLDFQSQRWIDLFGTRLALTKTTSKAIKLKNTHYMVSQETRFNYSPTHTCFLLALALNSWIRYSLAERWEKNENDFSCAGNICLNNKFYSIFQQDRERREIFFSSHLLFACWLENNALSVRFNIFFCSSKTFRCETELKVEMIRSFNWEINW